MSERRCREQMKHGVRASWTLLITTRASEPGKNRWSWAWGRTYGGPWRRVRDGCCGRRGPSGSRARRSSPSFSWRGKKQPVRFQHLIRGNLSFVAHRVKLARSSIRETTGTVISLLCLAFNYLSLGGLHSTEVAFALLTQQPQVQIPCLLEPILVVLM